MRYMKNWKNLTLANKEKTVSFNLPKKSDKKLRKILR